MHRRTFLMSTGLAALLSATPRAWAQGSATPAGGDPALAAAFQKIFDLMIDNSPQYATSLGLDKGPRAKMKYVLDDDSLKGAADELEQSKQALAMLDAFKGKPLNDADSLNLEVVRYSIGRGIIPGEKYGLSSIGRPYRIFQQGGAYFQTPDFLDSTHTIVSKDDCEAYLSRLAAFATALDNDSAVQTAYAERGYLAPGWSLDLTLGQMRKLRGQPAESCSMVASLTRRAGKAGIDGAWAARASKIVTEAVYPALDRQIALIERLKPTTRPGDGVWRVPRGDEIYADALINSTTTTMSPDEVHRLGIAQVAEITAELNAILDKEGFAKGAIGSRLAALNVRADQLYADSAEGRAALIKQLNEDYVAVKALLPRAFSPFDVPPLEIRAVPVEIQDGASNGYYHRAALDGSRPAIYFINLKDVGDWPKYGLPALTFHEGVPGHHLQISIQQQSGDIPMLRKIGGFSAYSEGWALYAEQLADELGAYRTPLDRAGFLQSFLFRAARLVVDTGLHAKQWSREKATAYMVETTGFAQPRCQREVERYCTQPGQACSYKVGHAAWTRARAKAQAALGAKFDLKSFHDILRDGAMPLAILEQRLDAWTAARLKA